MTFSPSAKPDARQKAVAKLIATLNADDRPILCGPYRSELGFEVSYWLPFLRHLAKHVNSFANRAAIVTRGGLAPLYAAVAHQGYDLYALRSVTDVRRENLFDQKQTGLLKQTRETDWDADVLADAAAELQLGALYHVIHPAWMYWALAPYWEEAMGLRYLLSLTDFTPLAKPPVPAGELPPRYVAVKFYGRATLPYPHPDVAEFVQRTVATIAAQTPVVLLNTSDDHDDHIDIAVGGSNIYRLPSVPAEDNLRVQAAVLAHATAFVGTYGGVAQLALRLGVPSCSVYLEWGGTAHAHLSLSSWLSKGTKVPFLVGSLADTVFWKQIVSVPVKTLAPAEVAA